MGAMGEALRERGVRTVLWSQILARMPQGVLSIIMLIRARDLLGGYTVAGIVVAVFSVTAAVASPLTGRLLGRFGLRRVLLVTATVDSLAIAAFGVLPANEAAFLVAGAVIGLFTPPVLPVARTLYPVLVPLGLRSTIFSIDASAQELIWAVGPVLATVLLPWTGPVSAFALIGGAGLLGAAVLSASPAMGRVPMAGSGRRLGAVLLKWPVLIAILSSLMLNIAYGATQAGIVARFETNQLVSGMAMTGYAVASILSGLLMSSHVMRPASLALRQLPSLAALAVLPVLLGSSWWVGVCVFVYGAGASPALAVMQSIVSSSLRPADAAEAYGWMGSAMLAGIAFGSAVAGVLIDHVSVVSVFVFAAAVTAVGILLGLRGRPLLPDLRQRTGPPDDTSAIPVIRFGR